MQFYVNEDCIGCGLCVSTCPEVFSMSDAGTAQAIEGEVAPELLDGALAAQSGCPVEAIQTK